MKMEYIYRVAFKKPPIENDDRTEFYFTSLSAIYDEFTSEQIGCKVNHLWNCRITKGSTYSNGICEIAKCSVRQKRQEKPCKRL